MANTSELKLAVFPCKQASDFELAFNKESDFEQAFNKEEHREIDWWPSRMNSSTLRAMQELVSAMLTLPNPPPRVDMCVFRVTAIQENGRKFVSVEYLPFEKILDAYNDLLDEAKQVAISTLFDEMQPIRFEFKPVQ